MIHVEFGASNLLLVLVVSYPLGLLASWALHFIQHQTIFNVPVYYPHWRDHHLETDAPEEWRKRVESGSPAYWVTVVGHGMWFLLAFGVCLVHFVLFTPWVAAIISAVTLATGTWHWYLHQMSHAASGDCWLSRFEWFEREMSFHRTHHLTSSDFANAKNYAFGDPFSKHVMDYLFGTLAEADVAQPHRERTDADSAAEFVRHDGIS